MSGSLSPAASDPRVRAGMISVVIGVAIVGVKVLAWQATGSAAILSDAFEGLTNVVAAAFSLGAILFARRPADRGHPYGHGKIEHMSALFEGGLIAIAAVLTAAYAVRELWRGPEVAQLDLGLALTVASGLGNALLGVFLLRTGRAHQSTALVADGQHVLADFKTTVGVVAGLFLVRITGWAGFDAVAALVVAGNLAATGYRLVREGAGALLDEGDPVLLARILQAFPQVRPAGVVRLHNLRALRSGADVHLDFHVIVPEFWTVEAAHDVANTMENQLFGVLGMAGDASIHTDPCRRRWCEECDLLACPVREEEFEGVEAPSMDDALRVVAQGTPRR